MARPRRTADARHMLLHRRTYPPTGPTDAVVPGLPPAGSWPPATWAPVAASARACCCPAAPVVQVVLAPPAGCDPVELLLCGHHYRASRPALRDGTPVYDVDGMPLLDPLGAGRPAQPQPLR
jgi:hypothetical protein